MLPPNLNKRNVWGDLSVQAPMLRVLVEQRWKFFWASRNGWTDGDKRRFEQMAVRQIRVVWHGVGVLRAVHQPLRQPLGGLVLTRDPNPHVPDASLPGEVDRINAGGGLKVHIGITIVPDSGTNQHVDVVVHEGVGQRMRSYAMVVDQGRQRLEMQLDSRDVYRRCADATMRHPVIAHEFGHLFGADPSRVAWPGNIDEYQEAGRNNDARHFGDQDSIMNGGAEVRARHFAAVAAATSDVIGPGINFVPTLRRWGIA